MEDYKIEIVKKIKINNQNIEDVKVRINDENEEAKKDYRKNIVALDQKKFGLKKENGRLSSSTKRKLGQF